MLIRPETPDDLESIERVHIAAFANHPHSRQTEHLIVNALRADHALAVSLVAEAHDGIAGHIAFSRIRIDERDCNWFALGPVGVLPGSQRRGIGQALIRGGLNAIRGQGAEGCVLVGDPAYYSRFGFAHNPALAMAGVPAAYLLCLPMAGGAPRGAVSHHPAFGVTG